MALTDKLTAIADAIRGKTGKTEEMTLDQMVVEIAGISGGSGEIIGSSYPAETVEAMLYALTNGSFKHGTFTLATALPNTETLIFSSGLDTINGILIVEEGFPYIRNHGDGKQRTAMLLHFPAISELNTLLLFGNTIQPQMVTNAITQGTMRVDGGDFYATAKYNANINYTPFSVGTAYTWIAW